MWNLIVSVPDHCLSFYFSYSVSLFLFLLVSGALPGLFCLPFFMVVSILTYSRFYELSG